MEDKNEKNSVGNDKSIYNDDIFKIPFDKVTLPSGAVLYGNTIPPVIDVEFVIAKDEDILYSPELMENGIMFNVLVETKIKDKSIKTDDLLVGDFNEILLFLRKNAYGTIYKINTYDPDLKEIIKKDVDLTTLKRKPVGAAFDEIGEFEFVLPMLNKRISFKLPNVGLTNYINNRALLLRDKVKQVTPYLRVKLETLIMSVEGIRDKTYISKFVEIIPPLDRLAFMEYLDKIEPGVDLNYTFKSSIKENEYTQKLIFATDFFYPTTAE